MNAFRCLAMAVLLACPVVRAQESDEEAKSDDKTPAAWVLLGNRALRAGDRKEAVAAYKAAIESDAEAFARLYLGDTALPKKVDQAPKTPPETRKRIDALVRRLLDPFADERDAEATAKDLVAIGPPMIAPLIGALLFECYRMDGSRTLEEGLRLTALRRGDACLRTLDPFLDAAGKARIEGGSDREHVSLVLRVHYARCGSVWDGRQLSVHDPPPDLPHLEDTPAELRRTIDELVALLFDPEAGRNSLTAKEKLAVIGKPAFPRVLGAMARVGYALEDEDTFEERIAESGLYLADQCLRLMDGYCDAKNYQPIRPGTNNEYIGYILKIHYKRWRTFLKDLPEMPGPHVEEKEDK